MASSRQLIATVACSVSLAACSGDSGTGRVELQLSTRMMMPMAVAASAAPITVGGDEIVIEQVEVVLRKIKVTGVGAGECAGSGAGGTEAEGDVEACGEFRAGPELFDLPLGDGAVPAFTATVPVGSYSEVQFQIHRPTDANDDAAFLADHPGFENTSIRVTGTYQKAGDPAPVPFIYTTDLTEVVSVELEQPIDVAAGAELGVTLAIDLSGWFANADRTGLVDPAQALDGQPLESEVEQNIRASFRMFEDENEDGAAD